MVVSPQSETAVKRCPELSHEVHETRHWTEEEQ